MHFAKVDPILFERAKKTSLTAALRAMQIGEVIRVDRPRNITSSIARMALGKGGSSIVVDDDGWSLIKRIA